jgi:hypothetical protein
MARRPIGRVPMRAAVISYCMAFGIEYTQNADERYVEERHEEVDKCVMT